MVFAAADRLPSGSTERLEAEGIRVLTLGNDVRFVTHKDIDDGDMDRVVKVLDGLATD
jgi:hypothetical protein